MYWKNPRTVRRRTVRHRRVFDSDGMDIKKTPRTDARHASIVRQGLEWALTYGQRSAAAFLLVRKVPRPEVERIPISMDGRGRALVVIRQSRRRWEDAYVADVPAGPGITRMAASSNFIGLLPTVLVSEASTARPNGTFSTMTSHRAGSDGSRYHTSQTCTDYGSEWR